MAALSQARATDEREGDIRSVPVKAGVTIHQGSLAVLQAGVAIGAITALSLTGLGRAEETVTGGGADGDVRVDVKRGVFLFANDAVDPIALADVGGQAFAVDDQTVAKTDGTNTRSAVGAIFDVDAAGVWVQF